MYFLARNGQQQGPYSDDELRRMVSSADASPADLVWKEGMPSWVPLSTILSGGAPPPPLPPAAGLTASPPNLHWALIILFSWLTSGLFHTIWAFVEAFFVKKIDPASKAVPYLVCSMAGFVGCMIVAVVGAVVTGSRGDFGAVQALFFGVAFLLFLVWMICPILANFQMRDSMVNYYNRAEPIGLRMSGAMTFFFGTFYIQHHLSRIAKWKLTGVLEPQG